MNRTSVIFLGLIIIVAFLSFTYSPKAIIFKKDLTNIGQLIGSLLIISLVMERALDVFLTTWRANESEELDLEIQKKYKRLNNLETKKSLDSKEIQELNTISEEINGKKKQRQARSAHTRTIALWAGMLVGVIISSVGVRTLYSLLEITPFEQLSDLQQSLFHIVDVLLTGGLLAGGSDGIHKFMDAYRNFMEQSSEKAKSSLIRQ